MYYFSSYVRVSVIALPSGKYTSMWTRKWIKLFTAFVANHLFNSIIVIFSHTICTFILLFIVIALFLL